MSFKLFSRRHMILNISACQHSMRRGRLQNNEEIDVINQNITELYHCYLSQSKPKRLVCTLWTLSKPWTLHNLSTPWTLSSLCTPGFFGSSRLLVLIRVCSKLPKLALLVFLCWLKLRTDKKYLSVMSFLIQHTVDKFKFAS